MPIRNSARTEKIVEVAAGLFASQGYRGTSTRQIARLAEVSENTLFRHFDHKEDIFWSAFRWHTAALTPHQDQLDGMTEGDAPEVVLPKILELLLNTIHSRPGMLRLIAVACLELQGNAEVICRDLASPFLAEINRYLSASIEKGEVLQVDPSLLAAAVMSTVLMHPQLSRLTNESSTSQVDSGEMARVYSKFWLDVLSPRSPSLSRSTGDSVIKHPTAVTVASASNDKSLTHSET